MKPVSLLAAAGLALGAVAVFAFSGAARADGPKDGLYLMTRFLGGSLEIKAYYFRDGRVSLRPIGDLDSFDFDAAAKAQPDTVGTVAVKGETMAVTWGDGNVAEAKVEPDGECFTWNMGIFCPAKTFEAGERLSGTFEGGASGLPGLGSYVANSNTLVFKPDGTYTRGTVGSVVTADVSAGSTGSESGQYEIAGGTLLRLKPEGKPAYDVLTFPYDDGSGKAHPPRMYFNGTMLKRVE